MAKLPLTYYLQNDVIFIAKDLVGKVLVTKIDDNITSGIITETEAYNGIVDRASHAYGGKITNRNKIMYHKGGVAYVYICYGIHFLFNVVTNIEGIPHAVLIRGIYPYQGIDLMLKRRNLISFSKHLFNGPGKVTKALKIEKIHNGISLTGEKIWIEDVGKLINPQKILSGPRIGIEYAKEDALLPYRFWVDPKEINF